MFKAAAILVLLLAPTAHAETAIVAGGCFWCVEANFEHVEGVRSAVSGYTGGDSANPTYDNHEGHFEAVRITFDPDVLPYSKLIALFLRSVDVTDAGGQFCDRGPAYRTAIFVTNTAQRDAAQAEIAKAESLLGHKIVTPVLAATPFWNAEAYHQDYSRKSDIVLTRRGPMQMKNAYAFYRKACGRDARVRALWGAEAAFVK